VTDDFMHLLAVQNPVAIVILAYYAVLLNRAHSAWWLKDWPHRILNAAMRVLAPTPELTKWLDWPWEQCQTPMED
jgi:hypothetical protein